MIDAPVHIAKLNFGFQLEGRRLRRLGKRMTDHTRQHHGGDEQRNDYPKSR